ncbi:carboxylesterase family protein [Xylariaceae sp. FL0594]|nr:carboxylesterase family protein [Xylariaceae sp. FL0594]
MMRLFSYALVAGLSASAVAVAVGADLPVVDLGYQRHRAIAFNTTGDYYNFTNIRFGQPPVGNLRWAAPKAPLKTKESYATIVDGSEQGGNCPQVGPCWLTTQAAFTEAYLIGDAFNFNATNDKIYANGSCSTPLPLSARDPLESEDCLFLDVMVPRTIFNKRHSAKAPVLVYIFSGGFTFGAKNNFGPFGGSSAGLLSSSRISSPDGLIYVAINYRLGALGWMFGDKFASEGGVVNAGLYDQRLALEWVQKNIHLFGGDPERVTVMGESSGGGSILMQMTAYGTGQKAPFKQAITQSGGWEPATVDVPLQNQIFDEYLSLLNVTSLKEARKLSSKEVIDANQVILLKSTYGTAYFGPVPDGKFVPDDPKRLLRDGKVDKSVKLLTSIAGDEGLRFTSANITSEADFQQFLGLLLESANDTVRAYVSEKIYPPVFDGSLGYTNQRERAGLFRGEIVITCNIRYLHDAVDQAGYAHLWDAKPSLHLGDVAYVFWNGPQNFSPVNGTVARVIQNYITAFAITGDPNNKKSPALPTYDGKSMLRLSRTGFDIVADPTNNDRCAYWQDATYWPKV